MPESTVQIPPGPPYPIPFIYFGLALKVEIKCMLNANARITL